MKENKAFTKWWKTKNNRLQFFVTITDAKKIFAAGQCSQLTECKAQTEKAHDYMLMARKMYKNKRFDLFESYIGIAIEATQPKGEKQ